MDTTKCRLLLHVIREGSLSAAAQRLGYTPSGVMRAINSLEDEIGFPLLSRTTQGVSLTKEGRAILPLLRDFLRCEERIQQASSRINGIEEGEIVVGAYYSVAANWLPKMIKTFQEHYPHISVHVEEMGNDVLYKNIENHRFDCAITTWRSSAYDWIPLVTMIFYSGCRQTIAWPIKSAALICFEGRKFYFAFARPGNGY